MRHGLFSQNKCWDSAFLPGNSTMPAFHTAYRNLEWGSSAAGSAGTKRGNTWRQDTYFSQPCQASLRASFAFRIHSTLYDHHVRLGRYRPYFEVWLHTYPNLHDARSDKEEPAMNLESSDIQSKRIACLKLPPATAECVGKQYARSEKGRRNDKIQLDDLRKLIEILHSLLFTSPYVILPSIVI